MPQVLSDDGDSVQVQLDDGSVVRVPKQTMQSVAPGMLGAAPAYPGAPEPDMGAPVAPLRPSPLPGAMGSQSAPGMQPPLPGTPYELQPSFAPPVEPSPALPQARPAPSVPAQTRPAPGAQQSPPSPPPGRPLSPTDQARRADDTARAGILVGADAQARGAAETAGAYERERGIYEQHAADEEAQRKEFEQQSRVTMAEYKDAQKKWLDAKPDPKRLWKEMSTGQEVLAWVGVALSGLGSAMQGKGGKNQALEMINAAIERDVQLQLLEIDKMGRVADAKLGEHNLLRQSFMDDRAVKEAMVANRLRGVQAEINSITARTTSETVKANAVGQLAGIDAAAVAREENARRYEMEFREQQRNAASQRAQGWARVGIDKAQNQRAQEQWDLEKARASGMQINPELVVPGLTRTVQTADGKAVKVPFAAASKEDAKQLRQQKAAFDGDMAAVERYLDLVEKYEKGGGGFHFDRLSTKESREVMSAWSAAQTAWRRRNNTGAAMSAQELAAIDAEIGGDPTQARGGASTTESARTAVSNQINVFNAQMSGGYGADSDYVPPSTRQRQERDSQRQQGAQMKAEDQAALSMYGDNKAGLKRRYAERVAQAKRDGETPPSEEVWLEAVKSDQRRKQQRIRSEQSRSLRPAGQEEAFRRQQERLGIPYKPAPY